MKNTLLLVAAVVLSSSSFAQVNKVPTQTSPVKKPLAKVPAAQTPQKKVVTQAPVVRHFDLNSQYENALQDKIAIDAERKLLIEHYDSCKFEILDAKAKYNQWFLDHFEDFKNTIPDVTVLNEKITRIKSIEVAVNPVENNTTDTVPVTIQKLADFIKIYNGRVQTCSNNQTELELFEKHMKDPAKNSLGFASTQVPKAIELLTPFLNEKQSETSLVYKLNLLKNNCKLSLAITVYRQQQSGAPMIYQDSLIDETGALHFDFKNQSETAWKFYTQNWLTVSDQAIDGFSRYFEFLKDVPAHCLYAGNEINLNLLQYSDLVNSGAYLSYANWVNEYKNLFYKVQNTTQPTVERLENSVFKGPFAIKFIPIQSGKFTMGVGKPPGDETAETSTYYSGNYANAHTVILSHSIEMQTSLLTWEQYNLLMNRNEHIDPDKLKKPVNGISFLDITRYANKASELMGLKTCYTEEGKIMNAGHSDSEAFYGCKGYRLPTEAECEYATRAGTTTSHFGSDNLVDAFFTYKSGDRPNPWGFYEMLGPIYQIVQDLWDGESNYPSTHRVNPLSMNGKDRVFRGALEKETFADSSSAHRSRGEPNFGSYSAGFRLVRTIK